jgi:hypothetical protein
MLVAMIAVEMNGMMDKMNRVIRFGGFHNPAVEGENFGFHHEK